MIVIYEGYIVPMSILVPLLFGMLNRKVLSPSLRVIVLFLAFSGVCNIVAVVLALYDIPNLLVFHIYSAFEFALISQFFRLQFARLPGKLILTGMIAFMLICAANLAFLQKHTQFNTYTRSLEAIAIVCYSMLLFKKQGDSDHGQAWGSIGLNWINAGILVYYSCCLFTFLFTNYLLAATRTVNHIVWCAVDTILLLEYILFAIGFYVCKNQRTIPSIAQSRGYYADTEQVRCVYRF